MTLQTFHATQALFDMNESIMSLKKRFLIIGAFVVLFILIFVISLVVKKNKPTITNVLPTPTSTPIGSPKDSGETTQDVKIESSPASKSNNLGNISFKYTKADIPASGTIYSQAPTSIPADIVSKIQGKLIAGGSERIINTPNGQVIFMQIDSKTLTIYLYSRMVVFSDDKPSEGGSIDANSLTKRASDFVKALSLPIDGSAPVFKYFSERTGDLSEVGDIVSANIIDVSFKESVHGLTVFREYGSDAAIHVWFSKEGEIIKLTYFYSPQYEPKNSITLPPLKEAEEKIKKNEGTIVGMGKDYQQTQLDNPSSTVFSSVEVGYFNNGKDTILYPIFIFRGVSTVGNNQAPITVYLPIAN